MYSSCIEKSQIIQRRSFLNSSTTFTSQSRAYSVTASRSDIRSDIRTENRELRKYPTEFVEQIDNKSDNRYHHTILNQSKAESNSNLASPSKIFGSKQNQSCVDEIIYTHRKNQSLGNIGNWKMSLPTEPVKTISKKLDQAVPMSELIEISRILDCQQQEEMRSLSRGYVNELFQLAQTIDRKLRNIQN